MSAPSSASCQLPNSSVSATARRSFGTRAAISAAQRAIAARSSPSCQRRSGITQMNGSNAASRSIASKSGLAGNSEGLKTKKTARSLSPALTFAASRAHFAGKDAWCPA